jgi:dihydroorotate dehydrogenase electron transfer subunit
LSDRRFLMELTASAAAFKKAQPGQFLHVRIESSCDPLLRRPLSIHDIVSGRKKGEVVLKVLYEVVGKGTELLSEKAAGTTLDVLGPLGNGFDVERIASAERIVLVAGGLGVILFSQDIVERAKSEEPRAKYNYSYRGEDEEASCRREDV